MTTGPFIRVWCRRCKMVCLLPANALTHVRQHGFTCEHCRKNKDPSTPSVDDADTDSEGYIMAKVLFHLVMIALGKGKP